MSGLFSTNVIILSQHSLFVGAVASKLQELSGAIHVCLIDAERDDVQTVILAEKPTCIIMDMGDSDLCQRFPIPRLLEWAPRSTIIRLDINSDVVSLFTSQQVHVNKASELFALIQSISGNAQ